ncbi:MAG: aspartyl protease family protein [Pseudomonadota bacterium]
MRLITVIASLLAIAIVSVRTAAAEPVASIPYRIEYNGWYTVDITVNGRGPYQFIVDTGATLTAVFENMTESQDFEPADVPEKRVLGIIGAQELPAVKIGGLEAGGIRLDDHVGVIIPDWDDPGPKPHGVLGLDFLSRYIVLFDAVRQRIEFFDPGNPPTDEAADMTRTRLRFSTFNRDYGGLYTINVSIANRTIPCIVDLGADGTLLNYRTMRRLLGGIYVDPRRETGSTTGSKIRDVFGDESAALSIRAGPIRINGARWDRRTFLIYNAGIFQELGINRKSYGLLGADLLRDRSFIFDFPNERFYVTRRAVIDAS